MKRTEKYRYFTCPINVHNGTSEATIKEIETWPVIGKKGIMRRTKKTDE